MSVPLSEVSLCIQRSDLRHHPSWCCGEHWRKVITAGNATAGLGPRRVQSRGFGVLCTGSQAWLQS